MKQAGIAIHMYLADNNEILPNRDRWMDVSEPYIRNKEALRDPEVKTPGHYGYSFDSRLSDKPYSGFGEPYKQSMVFDSVNMAKNASDPFISLPRPGRHKGKSNVAYLDGHARSVEP